MTRGLVATAVPLRSALPSEAPSQPVRFEILVSTGDSSRTQPGVRKGVRRTGEIRTRPMPVFDRFVPTLERPVVGEYVISGRDTATLRRLALHGVAATPLGAAGLPASLEQFVVDSVVHLGRPFQGHQETRAFGRWVPADGTAIADPYVVPVGGRAPLVMYLLDPESDDGFGDWDLFGAPLTTGVHPVRRQVLQTLRR
jgi:hypothetical protein